jgi:hypothetical protein
VQEKMVPKCQMPESISLRAQGQNYRANIYELEIMLGKMD